MRFIACGRMDARQQCRVTERHFACLFIVVVANHVLWVEPFWGFHHTYTIGAFAWLVFGGQDGFSISVNPFGLAITVFCCGWLYVMMSAFRLFG